MLGCQTVFDGHHQGSSADGMLTARVIVGVEVANDEAATMEIKHHWWRRAVI